jgi:hypothetical protein
MNFAGGLVLIAVAIVMIYFSRPKDGVSASFLKGPWILGQAYVMTSMIAGVLGVATIIVNWP